MVILNAGCATTKDGLSKPLSLSTDSTACFWSASATEPAEPSATAASQLVADGTVLNLPVGQATQAACAIFAVNVPATHAMHVVMAEAPVAAEKRPLLQAMHTDCAASVVKRPVAQSMQVAEPLTGVCLPAGHAWHVDDDVAAAAPE